MKKLFFFLFLIGILTCPALADFRVDSVDVSAEVSAGGVTSVTQVIQLTFDSIQRDVTIPLPVQEASRISVGDHRFSVEENAGGVDVVVKNKDGFAGSQSFLIRYSLSYADDGDAEADTYTLGLLSSRWAKPVGSVTFAVQMPQGFETPPVVTSGYHGDLTDAAMGLSLTDTAFSGSLSDRMAFDSLTATLTLPDGYFRVRRATVPVISLTFLAMGMGLVLLLCVIYWRRKLRSPAGAGKPRLLLPEGVLTCQLPMVLDGSTCDIPAMILEWANLGYLSISQTDKGVVALTQLMYMGSERSDAERALFRTIFARYTTVAATPGRFSKAAARFRAAARRSLYPVIFDRKGGNPIFVQIPCRLLLGIGVGYLSYKMLPDYPAFIILAVVFGILGVLFAIYLHSATAKFAALRQVTWVTPVTWLLAAALPPLGLLFGALPEVLIGLIACLFSAIATAPGPRRSSRGLDVLAQARGCRTFYREASWQRLQILQGQSSRFFQTQLPRAVALGSDRQFAARFERLSVPMPEWLRIPAVPLRSASALQAEIAPLVRQLREAFR